MPILAVLLEDVSGNFTINITTLVKLPRGWNLRRGRNDEQDDVDPGRLTLQLDNFDGRFTLGSTFYSGGIYDDKRIRITEQVGAITYIRHTGYVQNWPTEWESPIGNVALCSITSMDRQARLNRRKLRPTTEHEILSDGPYAYFTLGEAAGATSAGDTSGNGRGSLGVAWTGIGSSAVPSGTRPKFGSTAFNTWDGVTSCELFGTLYSLQGSNPVLLTISTSLTIEIAGVIDPANPNSAVLALQSSDPTSGTTLASVGLSALGSGQLVVVDITGATLLTSPSTYNDGLPHVFAVTVSGTTFTLFVDGVSVATGVGVAIPSGTNLFVSRVGGSSSGGASVLHLGHFSTYTSVLSTPRLLAHANTIVNGFAAERSDQRIARLAGYANIPVGEQDLETGIQTAVQAAATKDQSACESMKAVVTAEGGNLFIAGDGKLTFHNRQHRVFASTQTAAVALLAEDLVLDDTKFDAGKDYLVNTATGTRRGGAEQRVASPASIAKYEEYPSTDSDLMLVTDQQTLDLISWKVNAYSEVQPRMAAVTIDLLTLQSQATVQAILAVEIGDRITVATFPTQSPASTADLIVEGLAEDQVSGVANPRWRITFNTVPAVLFNAWILGDATYGVLGSTTRLHW